MKKLLALLLITFVLVACNKEDSTAKLEIFNDSPIPISSITLHYYVDGRPQSTGGAMNADQSFMEKGDSFVFDILPDSDTTDKQVTVEVMAERKGEASTSLGTIDISGYEEGERITYRIIGDSFRNLEVSKNK